MALRKKAEVMMFPERDSNDKQAIGVAITTVIIKSGDSDIYISEQTRLTIPKALSSSIKSCL